MKREENIREAKTQDEIKQEIFREQRFWQGLFLIPLKKFCQFF